jgi:hypothetical protein
MPPSSRSSLVKFNGWIVTGSGSGLIALMDDNPTPLIAVSCSSALGAYSLSVRLIDRRDVFADQERKANYFRFLAWSDSGPAQEFTALVPPEMPEFGELWVSTNPAIYDKPEVLWDMFKTSRVKFSYSTPSGFRTVKAGDLPTAVAYFENACGSIRPKHP